MVAWRTRGRVPLGVDSTACLVEARQHDRAAAGGDGSADASGTSAPLPPAHLAASESELRLQYGLAVVRMVNGIADSSQRGRVAASVASLAAVAGGRAGGRERVFARAGPVPACCFASHCLLPETCLGLCARCP